MSTGRKSEVISLSLPSSTVDELENMVRQMGYSSRSELIRDAIRDLIRSREVMDSMEGTIEGVIIIMYDHSAGGEVSRVRHGYMDIFRAFMHADIHEGVKRCSEVLMFTGDAESVRTAFYELRAIKGVTKAEMFVG